MVVLLNVRNVSGTHTAQRGVGEQEEGKIEEMRKKRGGRRTGGRYKVEEERGGDTRRNKKGGRYKDEEKMGEKQRERK